MAYHIVGFTEREFFDSVGGVSDRILRTLQEASFRSMQAAARDRVSYVGKRVMEVRTIAAFEDGGLPAEFNQYMELFYLNDRALEECQAAGMQLKVIGTCATEGLPENAGILLRLPLYLQQSTVPNLQR
ncbi:MAG: hypothetical protein AAB225_05150 [Acidobacteriota bacterium]